MSSLWLHFPHLTPSSPPPLSLHWVWEVRHLLPVTHGAGGLQEGLTPAKLRAIVFGLLRNCTASLLARSWRLSGMCMPAVLLPRPWEAGAVMLGAACWALPSRGSRPTPGLSCCKTRGMEGGWLESKVRGKGAARGPRSRGQGMGGSL